MKTVHFTYEDIIGYAILIERRGIALYAEAAEAVKNEPGRNILLHLAEQERQHERYFMQLQKEVSSKNGRVVEMDDQVVGYLAALAESEIFADDGRPYDQKFETLQDVIEFGMQTEKDSILLCGAFQAQREEHEKYSQSIIQEEKRHLVQLVELRDLIEERGVYY